MIKHVGFSLLDKFSKSFILQKWGATQWQASFAIQVPVNKHKTHKLVSSVKTYLKVVGKGLGSWLRLGGRGVGGRKTKQTKKLFKEIEQTLLMGIPLLTSAWFGFNQA